MTRWGGLTQWDKWAACPGVSLRSQARCIPGSCWGRRSLTSAPTEADSCWERTSSCQLSCQTFFLIFVPHIPLPQHHQLSSDSSQCTFYLLLKGGCSSTPEQLHEASDNPVAHPPTAHSFDLLLQEYWKNFKLKKKYLQTKSRSLFF